MTWQRKVRRGTIVLALTTLFLAACGLDTTHQYVQSDDGRLTFRLPHHFTDVEARATGLDWVAGLDADPEPELDHLTSMATDYPFVLAQVRQFDRQLHETISLRDLRTTAVPDGRDPQGGHDDIRVLRYEPFVDERGLEGHVMEIELDTDGGPVTEAQIVALDPARTVLFRVRVACTTTCWDEHGEAAWEILDSVEFQP